MLHGLLEHILLIGGIGGGVLLETDSENIIDFPG